MFIAMNRFGVAKGSEAAFEQVWLSRDTHLDKGPGFLEFHLLKHSHKIRPADHGPLAGQIRALCAVVGSSFLWNKHPVRRIHPPVRVEDAEDRQTSRF
jgi:hypothetical protein